MDHKPATLKANIYLNDTPIAANLSKLLLTLLDGTVAVATWLPVLLNNR